MSVDANTLAVATRLCAEVGFGKPTAMERLAGGKNNRVFRLSFAEGSDLAFKSYFHDARDTRDRLKTEWNFLVHAWQRDLHIVPRPLAHDPAEHAGLYTFLRGEKLAPDAVSVAHVDAASRFIHGVNIRVAASVTSIRNLPWPELGLASEACLSIAQHLETVDRRVGRLAMLAEDAPHRAEAERFVAERLRPVWTRVRGEVLLGAAKAGMVVEQPLSEAEIIISPSDFGFHNALLRPDGVLQFIDFEYAGRDDPAKLVGDFYACPEIPTPQDTFERFVDRVVRLLELPETARARAHILRDVYRVKWACIILNDFLPSDSARRAFATDDDRSERCLRQLRKAEAKLAEIG